MPTQREREYYRMGFKDGFEAGNMGGRAAVQRWLDPERRTPLEIPEPRFDYSKAIYTGKVKTKRKLSAWNKFVKANSKKPRFRMRSGKLNLKKMAIAFRKTPAGRKRKK